MLYVFHQGGEAIIDGHRVTFKDGQLSWEKLPEAVIRQLAFPFIAPEAR